MERQAVAKAAQAEKSAESRSAVRQAVPESSGAADLLPLQRCLGNRALGRFVQAKLKVGASNDRYEQEADRVAEQVMRMSDPRARGGPEVAEPDAVQVRRACRQCEEELGKPSGDEELRRKGRPDTGSARASSPDERFLSTGGEPLPSGVRSFYEGRFDRDFSQVRVHTGPPAERCTDSLHAYAFTYGNHIWMGRGHAVQPSLLLAHELAHVVQQSQPLILSTKRKETPSPVALWDSVPVVRRFAPFWEPYEIKGGGGNHSLVLPAMGKENKIFTEAPVPNADLLSSGFDKKGKADFYRASTTIGVFFAGHVTPAELKSDKDLKKDGLAFPHKTESAPKTNQARTLTDSANAPQKVEIGDLKPSHGTIEALEGTVQLENYKQGFVLAHKEANDPRTLGDGNLWNPFSASLLGDLTVPSEFTHPSFTGQTERKLVLKRYSSLKVVYDPKPAVWGHLCVRPDPGNKGIWNYTWVPKTTPKAATLPPKIKKLGPEIEQKIIDPLTQSPLKPAKKSKTGPPPAEADGEQPAPQRLLLAAESGHIIRRKDKAVAPEKDTFDYEKWKSDKKSLNTEFESEKKTQEFKDAEGEILANQAHEAIRTKFGLSLPEVTGGKEPAKIVDKVEFWTGTVAGAFGLFRKVFGKAFVTVAQFVVKVRDRIREFLKKKRSHAGTKIGALGAALKAAFRVVKMAASFVIGKVVDRVIQSLTTGVVNKVKSIISSEFQDELEQKAAELDKLKTELEQKAVDTVEGLLGKTLGKYLDDFKKIEEVYNLISDLVGLINLVRWGARVIACLSPPALGCLWILAEAALDFALQKVAETCWFQQKIAPLFAKVKYLTTDLPNSLGDLVIGKIKGFLPEKMHDVFADLEKGEVEIKKDDIECDEEDSTDYKPHPLHHEVEKLYQKIGEDRADALGELLRKTGSPQRELTAKELKELGDAIVKNNVSAEQLREYAKNYPTAPTGISGDLTAFIERVKSGKPPTPDDKPLAPSEPPMPGEQGEAGKSAASPMPDDKQKGDSGVKTVDTKSRIVSDVEVEELKETAVRVVNPSWKHEKGAKPLITLVVYFKGEAKTVLPNVEAEVKNRRWTPEKAQNAEEADALFVYYEPKYTLRIDEIPGAFIGGIDKRTRKRQQIVAPLLTKRGEELFKKSREIQSAKAPRKQ